MTYDKKLQASNQARFVNAVLAGVGIYSVCTGDNSDLIKEVAKLYLKPGQVVIDPTWGKGVFWRQIDLTQYDFRKSDLKTVPEAPYDFRHLPYEDACADVVAFDPPYMHNPGKPMVDARYQNSTTTTGFYHADILRLYAEGMTEAVRLLKVAGYLWIKCMDEIESGYQRWSHIEIHDLALGMGLFGKDLFVLAPSNRPVIQHKVQQHARKAHSYLWVFKKASPAEARQLVKHGIRS
jgi:hypothetical protein